MRSVPRGALGHIPRNDEDAMASRSTKDLAVPCAVCGRAIAYSEAVGLDRTADKRFVESSPRVQDSVRIVRGRRRGSGEACDASAVAANRCCFPA